MLTLIFWLTLLTGTTIALLVRYLYTSVPVHRLRTSWTYTTPWQNRCRQAGLSLASNLALEQLPKELILCMLVSEDRHFFRHSGFDFREMKVAVSDSLLRGIKLRGCSTITQQLAKNFFLTPERSLKRKLLEAIYTIKLERSFSKVELLTLYFNNIEWADAVYGIASASDHYFGKAPHQLSTSEIIFLVSIVPAPRQRGGRFHQGIVTKEAWKLFDTLTRYLLVLRSYPQIQVFLKSGWDRPLDQQMQLIDLKALQFGHDRASRRALSLQHQTVRLAADELRAAFSASLSAKAEPEFRLAINS